MMHLIVSITGKREKCSAKASPSNAKRKEDGSRTRKGECDTKCQKVRERAGRMDTLLITCHGDRIIITFRFPDYGALIGFPLCASLADERYALQPSILNRMTVAIAAPSPFSP